MISGERGGDRLTDHLLIGYVIFLPVQFQVASDLNIAPSDLCLGLYALLAGWRIGYVRAAWSCWHWALGGIMLAGMWVSSIARGELTRYVFFNKGVGMGVLFLAYASFTSNIGSWKRLHTILRCLVLSVVIQNVIVLIAFFLSRYTGIVIPGLNEGGYRLSGMLLDANGYGGLLVLALALNEISADSELAVTSGWTRVLSTITLFIGILFTFSRSTWLSLSVVLILTSIFRRRSAVRMLGVLFISLPLIIATASNSFLSFMEKMAKRPEQVEGRVEILRKAFEYFPERPVWGIGLGTFNDREGVIIHNTGAWFLTEFGLVGLTVYVSLVGWFFVVGWRAMTVMPERRRPIVLALLVGHAGLIGLSFGVEAFYKREWWVLMACIGSAYAQIRSTVESKHRPVPGQVKATLLELG
ncbi:MAG: O-antigen ligase family protein [Acidobacteriota bacterium]|nr:O-antigen ligase family protein [Acidobacteriota bacterium]